MPARKEATFLLDTDTLFKSVRNKLLESGKEPVVVAALWIIRGILRQAFDATLRDTAFLTDAERIHFDIHPMDAAETAQIVHQAINASAEVLAKAKAALGVSDR